jgi:hypothetical protein
MTTSTSTRTRHLRRATVLVGGLAATAAVALAAPGAAFADTRNAQQLTPGQSTCASQDARYQVRLEGTATKSGAKFRIYRNGVLLYGFPGDTSTTATAEYRTSLGNFPGPGTYTICALNKQATNTFATLRVRSDAEI